MAASLILDQLSKRYHGTTVPALDGVSLQVNPGEVYGFLGANGAGKTTAIRTLMGFIRPTGGSAKICELDIVNDSVAVKRHVGYLAGEISLPQKLTGRQFLDYMASLQPVKDKDFLPQLAKRFGAELDKPLRELSKGNRQKIGLLQACMHQPDLLILDEPTSGLDPLMQEEFFRLMLEFKQRGASVFVSSHNFAEVQRMCDRIGFIREGRLVAEQTLAELAKKASHTFTLTFAGAAPLKALQALPRASVTAHDEHHLTVSLEGDLSPLFAVLARHQVTHLQQQEVNLEEEFINMYRKAAS